MSTVMEKASSCCKTRAKVAQRQPFHVFHAPHYQKCGSGINRMNTLCPVTSTVADISSRPCQFYYFDPSNMERLVGVTAVEDNALKSSAYPSKKVNERSRLALLRDELEEEQQKVRELERFQDLCKRALMMQSSLTSEKRQMQESLMVKDQELATLYRFLEVASLERRDLREQLVQRRAEAEELHRRPELSNSGPAKFRELFNLDEDLVVKSSRQNSRYPEFAHVGQKVGQC